MLHQMVFRDLHGFSFNAEGAEPMFTWTNKIMQRKIRSGNGIIR